MLSREQLYKNYCDRGMNTHNLDVFVDYLNSTIDNFDKTYKIPKEKRQMDIFELRKKLLNKNK